MEKPTEETAVDLMQLMLDEDWVREAVRIEEEAGCDIGAGFGLGVNDSEFLRNPSGKSHLLQLRSIILREFRSLLAEWNLGVGMEAAVVCSRQLLWERLQNPAPEVQQQLLAVLEEDLAAEPGATRPLRSELRSLLCSILTDSDWEAIATAAANAVREQVMLQWQVSA